MRKGPAGVDINAKHWHRALAALFDFLISIAVFRLALGYLTLVTQSPLSIRAFSGISWGITIALPAYHFVAAGRTRLRSPGEIIVGYVSDDLQCKGLVRNPFEKSRLLLFICVSGMLFYACLSPELPIARLLKAPADVAALAQATVWTTLFLIGAVKFSVGSPAWCLPYLIEFGSGVLFASTVEARILFGLMLTLSAICAQRYRAPVLPGVPQPIS